MDFPPVSREKKEAERERVKLSLAHDTGSLGRRAIHCHLERHASTAGSPFENDATEVDVALQPELTPHSAGGAKLDLPDPLRPTMRVNRDRGGGPGWRRDRHRGSLRR